VSVFGDAGTAAGVGITVYFLFSSSFNIAAAVYPFFFICCMWARICFSVYCIDERHAAELGFGLCFLTSLLHACPFLSILYSLEAILTMSFLKFDVPVTSSYNSCLPVGLMNGRFGMMERMGDRRWGSEL